MLALALRIADRSASAPRSRIRSISANASVHIVEAISPAAAPPMPSATMNSGPRSRYESSLERRTWPVWVWPALSTIPSGCHDWPAS